MLIGQLSFTFTGLTEFKSAKNVESSNSKDFYGAKSIAGRSTTQSSVRGSQRAQLRIQGKADSASTSQLAAAGTLLLWLRVIQYLNGFTATAAYVRMTLSVISDMGVFLLMMAILVVGNACVLVLLYPLALTSADNEQQLQDKFGRPPVLLAFLCA